MSGYLDHLEQQLIEATRPRRSPRAVRRRRAASLGGAVLLALLAASAVALAVTGTFSTGPAVRAPQPPKASSGAGIAARGTRLLPMRVPDPGGGLPWGMRVVRTTRGLICVQVARVDGSSLGVLGQDGAFGNDGRFHPVPPDVVGYHAGTLEISNCMAPGEAISQEAGIPQSAVFGTRHAEAIGQSAWRWISYGLLGPSAVSVSYRAEGRKHTVPVERGSGAYLLVLPDPPNGSREVAGGASASGPITPQGAISSIVYRLHGHLCSESRPGAPRSSLYPRCPRPRAASPPGTPQHLHREIGVRTFAGGGLTLTFKAPRAVVNALSGYAVEVPAPCHQGTVGIPVERDVRAGEVVHLRLPGVLANACGRTVTLRVVYERERERFALGQHDAVVGEVTVKR
jgi:hypothetical protein